MNSKTINDIRFRARSTFPTCEMIETNSWFLDKNQFTWKISSKIQSIHFVHFKKSNYFCLWTYYLQSNGTYSTMGYVSTLSHYFCTQYPKYWFIISVRNISCKLFAKIFFKSFHYIKQKTINRCSENKKCGGNFKTPL